ncbi:hypothetical protein SAVERM_2441 [Streptomyces avermitilis MA-4680 = NBRC 14893]|uniref:Uncharacterized protein n=1 Tax=Streptomyces avermitilis (strain ATCC 31267 / DSM 46492 / JCM 5070 / NBRC 14893 / NCIMB 12804 / NRRL 8165 / MA-4680) TaxID=227882 RepID=Q82KG2_STRAW|nr:hypothetical protein SAVERM_2441 [Streptomyces avermitilis MA-4680 = NBRC 14893]
MVSRRSRWVAPPSLTAPAQVSRAICAGRRRCPSGFSTRGWRTVSLRDPPTIHPGSDLLTCRFP